MKRLPNSGDGESTKSSAGSDKTQRATSERPSAAYESAAWVARRLGMHPDTFRRQRSLLAKAGFPEPDPLLRRYLVEDVEAWIGNRRKIKASDDLLAGDQQQEINYDAL